MIIIMPPADKKKPKEGEEELPSERGLQALGLDTSLVDLSEIPPDTCGACEQVFGDQDKDTWLCEPAKD